MTIVASCNIANMSRKAASMQLQLTAADPPYCSPSVMSVLNITAPTQLRTDS